MGAALTLYMLLGMADFGGGIWDLLARGPRGGEQRQLIARAMGPVWEVNHVWLIFFAVVLFTAFPTVFAALATALFLPLHLVLLGIVFRGSAFVLRTHGPVRSAFNRFWAAVFGVASLITPFLLGAALAVVVSGGIRSTLPLLTGLTAVALSAFLAAAYLAVESPRGEAQEDFRRRAISSGLITGLAALTTLLAAGRAVPWLATGLLRNHFLLPAAGVILLLAALLALDRRSFLLARYAAGGFAVLLLWSWLLAQWPYLIYPDLTAFNSVGPAPTLRFILRLMPVGLVVLVPSLALLFYVFKGENPNVPPARRST